MWTNERTGQTKKESLCARGQSSESEVRVGVGERASVENVFIRNTSVSNFLLGFRRSELHVYSNTLSLGVGYYTLFTFLPFFTRNIHINIQKYFSVVFPLLFFFVVSGHQFLLVCAFVERTFDYCAPLLAPLCFECVLCMLQTQSAFFLLPFVCSLYTRQYQAAVAAISSSEVFNASSTLMNYSNEPDIFVTDLQRRMPLALLLFPINKCLKCKVACTSIFTGLSHIAYTLLGNSNYTPLM